MFHQCSDINAIRSTSILSRLEDLPSGVGRTNTLVSRYPKMLRKASKAVPEGNGPVPQKEELESGQVTMADVYRLLVERFDRMDDRWNKKMDEISNEMRKIDQHVTRLEHEARQPRLAMEADGQASTKTRERTEGAATAVQAMRGDCFSARRVEPGPTTNSASFGLKAEPPALPCRDDGVVESGPAASESCLPSIEMRPSTAAGGLVPTGEASNASETTFNQPPLRFCLTEKNGSRGEKFMDFSSIRLVQQQYLQETVCYSLLPEGC